MLLPGKTALVTGGAIRVGRALSLGLAAAGCRVVIHHHSSGTEADALADEIRRAGGHAATLSADLSRHADVERLADEAEHAFGGVDVLVNNASSFAEAALRDVDEALWDRTIAINLKAPFFLTQRLGARMKSRGEGVVINLGDLAGIQSWRGYAAHAVSKAGLLHFTRVAARALAPEVRVNSIVPGTVLPPEDTPEEEVRTLAERAPLGRNGSPTDVVSAALYLIGADFVTGEAIVLDGGRSLA